MGSVRHLTTTGDNDPEIEPQPYHRHYLYCDDCGGFELDPWIEPEDHERLERRRRQLARIAAIFGVVLVAVPSWIALGLSPSPALLLLSAVGVAFFLLYLTLLRRGAAGADEALAKRWRFFRWALVWLVVITAVQLLATDLRVWASWTIPAAGLVLVIGVLAWRAALGSRIERRGLRCRRCGATYAYGSPFFTDLEANPLALTVDAVPRPMGSTPFERSEAEEDPATSDRERWSRLPE